MTCFLMFVVCALILILFLPVLFLKELHIHNLKLFQAGIASSSHWRNKLPNHIQSDPSIISKFLHRSLHQSLHCHKVMTLWQQNGFRLRIHHQQRVAEIAEFQLDILL